MFTEKVGERKAVLLLVVISVFAAVSLSAFVFLENIPGSYDNSSERVDKVENVYENNWRSEGNVSDMLETKMATLTPPAVQNVETRSIERVELGENEYYNWSVGFNVAENNFSKWNSEEEGEKVTYYYATPDGKYIFLPPAGRIESGWENGRNEVISWFRENMPPAYSLNETSVRNFSRQGNNYTELAFELNYGRFEKEEDDPDEIRFLVTRPSGYVFLLPFDSEVLEYDNEKKLENQYENVPIQFENNRIFFRTTLRLWDGNFRQEIY